MAFKMGRNRPVARGPRFKLRNYLMRSLPNPPATVDYTPKAAAALSQVYQNDVLGDCVIAGIGHVVGALTANANGTPFLYTPDQIDALYTAIGGYDPNAPLVDGQNPTDQGCDEITALNFWQNQGAPVGSHQIKGWMSVNPADATEVRIAQWLFENLYFGLELPDAWISPFPSAPGFVWDVADDPDPENGHCITSFGYGASSVDICTWGMMGSMTDAAIAKYCAASAGGALYTVISEDSISNATQRSGSGFDFSQLLADFDSMTS